MNEPRGTFCWKIMIWPELSGKKMIYPKCSIETFEGFTSELCENNTSVTVIWKDNNEEKICGKCFSDLKDDVYNAFSHDIVKIIHHDKYIKEDICPRCNGDRIIPVLDKLGNPVFLLGIKYTVRCPKCNGTGCSKNV